MEEERLWEFCISSRGEPSLHHRGRERGVDFSEALNFIPDLAINRRVHHSCRCKRSGMQSPISFSPDPVDGGLPGQKREQARCFITHQSCQLIHRLTPRSERPKTTPRRDQAPQIITEWTIEEQMIPRFQLRVAKHTHRIHMKAPTYHPIFSRTTIQVDLPRLEGVSRYRAREPYQLCPTFIFNLTTQVSIYCSSFVSCFTVPLKFHTQKSTFVESWIVVKKAQSSNAASVLAGGRNQFPFLQSEATVALCEIPSLEIEEVSRAEIQPAGAQLWCQKRAERPSSTFNFIRGQTIGLIFINLFTRHECF